MNETKTSLISIMYFITSNMSLSCCFARIQRALVGENACVCGVCFAATASSVAHYILLHCWIYTNTRTHAHTQPVSYMNHKRKNIASYTAAAVVAAKEKPSHARLRTTSSNKRGRERTNCMHDIIDGEIRCITIKILMMKYVCKTKRCAYNAKLCVKMLSLNNFVHTQTHKHTHAPCSLLVQGA